MAVQEVKGGKVTVRFDGHLCIHSRRCVMGAPHAFRPGVRDWIDADAESAEGFVRIAYACPSGAITVERHDGGPGESAPEANAVLVRENGPLAFHADMDVEGHGRAYRATICRCGLSKNKPFCDNSHIDGGFEASGEPEARDTELEVPDLVGPVTLTPLENGPLKVSGALEVSSGTGRMVARVKGAFFCRCGQSQNKPFCDGSHKRVGFEAPGI